jgi:hypothetical protein
LEVIIANQFTSTNIADVSSKTASFACGILNILAATEIL